MVQAFQKMKHLMLLRDHQTSRLPSLFNVFGIVSFVSRDVFDILFVPRFFLSQVVELAFLVFPHMLLKSQQVKAAELDCQG